MTLVADPLPRTPAVRVALGGLGLLAAWTLASVLWAPLAGDAYHAGQLAVLYAGALLAGTLLLRDRATLRWVEPAVAAGALAVVGYGLSERLLPGVVSLAHSAGAQGRLEQPLTYWNAMGLVAALGVVLCARLAGDGARPGWLRATAAAAAAPLGLGLSLTVSRGALFACAAGLLALVLVAGRREQALAAGLVVAGGALAAGAAAPFAGVTSLTGTRERDGAIVLVALGIVAAGTAAAAWRLARRVRPAALRLPRHAPALALAVVLAGFALALAVGTEEPRDRPLTPGAARLGTLRSNRYAYWRVAWRAWRAEPLHGVGAGGWAVWWRRLRTVREGARDAHSLPLQTAAELGLVGLALLAAWLAGMVSAARRVGRAAPGLVAGCVVWAAHVALDWDFQMPAATLPALVLGAAVLATAELTAPRRSAAPRG